MSLADFVPDDPRDVTWDVMIVGTGVGGATVGFDLARRGYSVLYVDRGKISDQSVGGEADPQIVEVPGAVEAASMPGRRPPGDPQPAPLVGLGIGGSTSIFSMVMDRMRPADFSPGRSFQVPTGTSLVDNWPIRYEELEPWYRDAETLYRVRGTADPLLASESALLDPAPPSDPERAVTQVLDQGGLHPYRIHYAREFAPGCTGCPGRLCKHECRNDAGRICVLPALRSHRAKILPECLVVSLETAAGKVSEAVCIWKGRRISIRARRFFLALNALLTPALLLRSASSAFPDGIGNRSGLVGCNLMMHVSDTLSLWLESHDGELNGQFHHGISLSDFYVSGGIKLGNIHAHALQFGLPEEMELLPGGAVLFGTIVEDFPYLANRIVPEPGSELGARWEYHYPQELWARSQVLTRAFIDALRPVRVSVGRPSGALNRTHMCGTCRFGIDPKSSVLDRNNRVHEIENLYVVDASFFPSSAGINPSLTIAANSLRVAAAAG